MAAEKEGLDGMKSSGFTLIELVVVLIVVGVLAVAAVPKFFERQTFETLGFFDQAQSVVRYAQKVAVAQRRAVYVRVNSTPGVVEACYDAGCAAAVSDPTKGAPLAVSAPSGVSLSAATFSFDGLGRPSFSSSLAVTVSGDAVLNFVVEPETGYVHPS